MRKPKIKGVSEQDKIDAVINIHNKNLTLKEASILYNVHIYTIKNWIKTYYCHIDNEVVQILIRKFYAKKNIFKINK